MYEYKINLPWYCLQTTSRDSNKVTNLQNTQINSAIQQVEEKRTIFMNGNVIVCLSLLFNSDSHLSDGDPKYMPLLGSKPKH